MKLVQRRQRLRGGGAEIEACGDDRLAAFRELRPAPIGTHTAAAIRVIITASCTPSLMRWPTLVEDVSPSTADQDIATTVRAPQRQGYSV